MKPLVIRSITPRLLTLASLAAVMMAALFGFSSTAGAADAAAVWIGSPAQGKLGFSGEVMSAATTANSATTGDDSAQSATRDATPAVSKLVTSPQRASGGWAWWGWRTNPSETWAIITQSPSSIIRWIPIFGQYVYMQARVWRLTAYNARTMGLCLGITWSGSGIIVGCA